LLTSFANQTALALDRVQLAEKARQAQVLRETERLQSALLNSISHDLRTPLASITGSLSSLKDDSAFLDDAAQADLVETALGEAERLNYLVNNLLDMSRLESGAVRLKLEPCDVEDLVGVVLEQMGNRLRHHPVTINLAPDLPLVPLDFVLVAQVLINLLDNAAKYSPDETEIELYAAKKDTVVEIGIADRGIGIPAASLAQVFNKFYRIETGDRSVGTGLGLTIAKAVVDAHGGEIMLSNRADGGTLAQIRFRLNTKNEGASSHGR
jgi:two-component system sensor histidine kinase KdpD